MSKEVLNDGKTVFAKTISKDWIVSHRKVVLAGCITLLLLFFVIFQWLPKITRVSSPINTAFYSAALESDLEELKKWEETFKKEPLLKSHLGQELAERFLMVGDLSSAKKYMQAPKSHLLSSYYVRFATNTFMITSARYEEALTEAKRLKKDLEEDSDFWNAQDKMVRSGSLLFAYNLIRIAALERQLGSKEGELAAWEEFIAHSGWEGAPKNLRIYDREAYSLIAQHFEKENLSFLDYIRDRQKSLTVSSADYTSQ